MTAVSEPAVRAGGADGATVDHAATAAGGPGDGTPPSAPHSDTDSSAPPALRAQALQARDAAAALSVATRGTKDQALRGMADALLTHAQAVLDANSQDVAAAAAAGSPAAFLDRLRLDGARLAAMADGLRAVAALPDPVGEVVRGSTLPNGLEVRQQRVPLGVIAIVYEARPNVTVDAAGLCIKSGNAVLLRGSATARHSNAALVAVLAAAGVAHGLPAAAVQLVAGTSHDDVSALLRLRGLVDVAIPRGGAALIERTVRDATVPVIETGVGNCHIYVDAAADLDSAVRILLDGKVSRPSVCNAAETVLVHAAIAETAVPRLLAALHRHGVTAHGDARAVQLAPAGVPVLPATDEDWAAEYLSLDIAVGVVDDLDAAIAHIRRWSSGHTEVICTRDLAASRRFCAALDSAAIMVNASPRFTDGGELGLGTEIGISTQKLHARGPMGLTELTTTKWLVTGDGHVRHAPLT